MLSPNKAANIAATSRTTIMRAINRREILASRNQKGHWRIEQSTLDAWIKVRRLPSALKTDCVPPHREAPEHGQNSNDVMMRLAEMTLERDSWRSQAQSLIQLVGQKLD